MKLTQDEGLGRNPYVWGRPHWASLKISWKALNYGPLAVPSDKSAGFRTFWGLR